jgi:hypothetical protein
MDLNLPLGGVGSMQYPKLSFRASTNSWSNDLDKLIGAPSSRSTSVLLVPPPLPSTSVRASALEAITWRTKKSGSSIANCQNLSLSCTVRSFHRFLALHSHARGAPIVTTPYAAIAGTRTGWSVRSDTWVV